MTERPRESCMGPKEQVNSKPAIVSEYCSTCNTSNCKSKYESDKVYYCTSHSEHQRMDPPKKRRMAYGK